jgi:hypothetical protein
VKRRIVTGAIAIALSATSVARAQSSAGMAETLFREGKRLMAEKRFADACPKLAESQRLDPEDGTLLTLALYHGGEGKLATAWSEFQEALALAEREGRVQRQRVARARIEALEPRLSHLTVRVPNDVRGLPELVIQRDGIAIGPAAWDVAIPVDLGAHRIEARAAGKQPWMSSVEVTADAQSLTVEVPPLLDVARPAPPPAERKPVLRRPRRTVPSAPIEPAPSSDGFRTAGWISGGIAVAAVGVGGFFTVLAISKSNEADAACPGTTCDTPDAITDNEDAGRAADAATVSFVVAGVALAFAAYALFVHEPSPARRSTRLARQSLAIQW